MSDRVVILRQIRRLMERKLKTKRAMRAALQSELPYLPGFTMEHILRTGTDEELREIRDHLK